MKHVIIGNGPTGLVAAETLRRLLPDAEIALIGDEAEPPYSRMAIPYFLIGKIADSGTHLRKSHDHYAKERIHLIEGRVVKVNAKGKQVEFASGERLPYDRLLIATGSQPIRPKVAGMDLPNVHTCWTIEDARAIAAKAKPGSRVLQLGAGFIGCIIMEALAARGVELTVVEMGDRMVPRMMTPKAGNMIRNWVEHKGVRVLTGKGVQRIAPAAPNPGLLDRLAQAVGVGGKADSGGLTVTLSDGEEIACDLVIVAAGVAPNVGFLDNTGVQVAKGVLVDNRMQTSVPGIYAAGDVAEAPDLFTGAHLVAAIQPNAADQARVAALNMAGREARLPGVLAINVLDTLGLVSTSFGQWWGETAQNGGSGVELADDVNHRYISLQFKDDVLIGATSIGHTEHVGVLRGLIQTRTRLGSWKDSLLQDPNGYMAAYLASAQSAA